MTYLEPGSHAHVLPEIGKFGYAVTKMNTYCYKGREKDLSVLLQSIILQIDIDFDDFNYFSGHTPTDVENAHHEHKSIFSFNLLSRSKKRVINLDPFNQTCIGVETAEEYHVLLSIIHLDLFKLALLAGGLFVFFSASKLSRNSAFYYLSGVLLGNSASILVLIWFISKLIPKKPLMYGALISGWSLAAYFAQIVFENIQPLLLAYHKYVAVYVLVTSCLSFGVCYYKGPPKHERSKNLIKWGLQLVSLICIFFSSEFREATIAIIGASIVLYYFPTGFFSFGIFGWFRRIWRSKFPEKRKLISKEEFEEQGRIETEKALKELREYVKSPKCKDQWKLVMNLSQPTRFASFVEGDQHLTMDETMEYDNTQMELSEDSSDETSDEIEESLAVDEDLVPINKSKLVNMKMQNGLKHRGFNTSAQVTSSTPNRSLRTRQANNSRRKPAFEISDDE